MRTAFSFNSSQNELQVGFYLAYETQLDNSEIEA